MKSLFSEFFGATTLILLAMVAAGLTTYGLLWALNHVPELIELARQIPAKTAAFFGFMGFFLWTTICSQCVINAQTRAAKQVWALMLYVAVWVLLVIHLQAQGLHL